MIVRFSCSPIVRTSQWEPNPEPKQGEQKMRMKIVPAVALSLMSFGALATVAAPAAHAATHAYAAGDDEDDTTPTVPSGGGGGGGGAPSGGVSTGAGGMAKVGSTDIAPFVAIGGAGAALLGAGAGASALARRRRSVNA
jgi:hypothetical protein